MKQEKLIPSFFKSQRYTFWSVKVGMNTNQNYLKTKSLRFGWLTLEYFESIFLADEKG